VQGASGPPVLLVRGRSPKTIRRKIPPQALLRPAPLAGDVRILPLNKRRGVSVEPVMIQRRSSGSSNKSNESKPQLPKLTTPTISFGDKMAGLREASSLKIFGPIKKLSQNSAEKPPEQNSVKNCDTNSIDNDSLLGPGGPTHRKNSTDALRTAVLHSKAALKKGLKIGSTGLNELRKHVHSTPHELITPANTPEKVRSDFDIFQ